MSDVLVDRAITVDEWEALEDPPGGRYEILDGRLVVNPSFDGDHSRFNEDLSAILRRAVGQSGLSVDVTIDVEWRTIAADIVKEAPRGDIVIGGPLDPDKRVHVRPPLLVVEIWSRITRPSIRSARRAYWANRGLTHYWDLQLGTEPAAAQLQVYDLSVSLSPIAEAAGEEELVVREPFPVSIAPAHIHGWTERESVRADSAEAEAARLRQRLLDLGYDPDS